EAARAATQTARQAAADTAARAAAAETALATAEEAAAAARSADAATRARLAEAEGSTRALAAEAAGLEKLLAANPGAQGQVLDRIRVAPGFEAALGAALADDLSRPVRTSGETAGGWHPLDGPPVPPLPEGAAPLAPRVEAPPELARRLA